jgi:prepilin-type N-terminal cleavage/methylation domain-containing protein
MSGRNSARRGFSLLEVIVAIGIVTVGVTAVLALFAAGVDTHKRSIDQSNAALAAQSLAAELEAKYTVARIDAWKAKTLKSGKKRVEDRDYLQDIPARGKEHPEIPGFPGYLYGVKFIPLDAEGNAVLARIEILWRKGGGAPATEEFPVVLLKRPY